MDTALRARLDAIGRMIRADQRGRELERFVADVFRQYHFKVTLNAGVARPRQTDVLAAKVNEVYLVECKWRTDKANIDDLDSLRSRLRRTNDGVVGILVSLHGFSGTVLHDVEHHREQPILLISGDELRLLVGPFGSLPDLLWRKKDALLTDGKVLLDEPPRRRSTRRLFALPAAERKFVLHDRPPEQVIECGGGFGQFVFTHELPDIDWVAGDGLGVTLDIAPDVHDQRGFLELVDRLADLGWATSDARWSIQQSRRNWHGLGSAAFARELPRWQQRAKSPSAHHSEEICYLDRCDGGFYTLTANLAAHRIRQTTMVGLSFQLRGSPVDPAPLLQWLVDPLCGTLNYAAHTTMLAINVALRTGSAITAAATADPFTDEVFWTGRQQAYLRRVGADDKITPSADTRLVDINLDPVPNSPALQATELLADTQFNQQFRPRVISTTLAVAWVAAGRRAAYLTAGDLRDSVHFAAGIALCQAAGCIVTGVHGQPLHTGVGGLIAAADRATHATLLNMISRHQRQ